MVEPADDVLQAFDPMPRLTGSRQLVRFVREPHHYTGNFPELERAEHFLAARAWWRAIVILAQNEHHRRRHVFDITDRRAHFKILLVLERRRFEPVWLKQCEIGRVPPMSPARDVPVSDGGGKSHCL